MKKFIKNAALLLLTGGLFLGTVNLGACSKVPDEPIDDDQKHEQVLPEDKDKDDKKPPVVPDEGKDDGNDDGKVDDKKALFEAAGRVSALVGEAEKILNFLYVEGEKSFYAQNLDDGFRLKVSTGNVDTYYVGTKNEPGAEAYYDVVKIYKNAEGSWVGEAATDEIITESPFILYGAEWTKFENGKLLGIVDNKSVSASVDEGLTTVTWAINNVEYSLGQIGEITLQIPEFEDLTKPAGEYVYETVNGQREYNIPVLAKALEETLKADSTILTKANGGIKLDLIKVTHIKRNEKGLGFGTYCSGINNSKSYNYFILSESYTADKLTDKDFKKYLSQSSLTLRTGSNCATSTLENDEEFKTMADNVLIKLAQDGFQGNSIKNKAEGLNEFANAKVLFGYKTKNSGITPGGDMGNQSASEFMLLVKKTNGKMEELNLKVGVANSQYGQNYNLLNLDTNKVLIIEFSRAEIDEKNAKLYENGSNIKLNTSVTPYFETKRN